MGGACGALTKPDVASQAPDVASQGRTTLNNLPRDKLGDKSAEGWAHGAVNCAVPTGGPAEAGMELLQEAPGSGGNGGWQGVALSDDHSASIMEPALLI